MDALLQDVRYGLRMLARNPGFALAAIVTLALGIGSTTAIFTVVNAVLLRPLPYPDSERLALIAPESADAAGMNVRAVAPGDFLDWNAQASTFTSMAAFSTATFGLTGDGEPERLFGAAVTPGFFQTLGVGPVVGVLPGAQDDAAVATSGEFTWGQALGDTAVISERLWRRRYASDARIVGRPIHLDGRLLTIAAVIPADFTFPLDVFRFGGARAWEPPDVWVPMRLEVGYRSNQVLRVVARVKRGVTLEQAQADMKTVAARINATLPADRRTSPRVEPLHDQIVRDVRPLLLVFLGAVGFVLLIACVNVANLLLARAASRQKEVAVRTALGSGALRLVRQFVTESVLLGVLGGSAGILVAAWGVDLALALVPNGTLPRLLETGFDRDALLFTLVISTLSGVLFGLAPALHSVRAEIVESLKEGAATDRPRLRILDALVVAEVALAFVLLVGAGLMVRSFLRLASVDPGFRTEHTLTLSVTLPESTYDTSPRMRAFARSVVERLGNVPGVVHAAVVNWLPLGGSMLTGTIEAEGAPPSTRELWVSKPAVTPRYFRAMGIPLVRGREFTERDTAEAPGVAIVTEQFVRRLWPGQDPIGKRVTAGFGSPGTVPWLTIVGVVGAVRGTELGDEPQAAVYVPLEQAPRPFLLRSQTFVLRTASDPLVVAAAARGAVRSVDPNLPIDRVATMENLVTRSVSEPRFRAAVLVAFAAAALALVATGILGVLAYAVARRTREIGVRVALGAEPSDVVRLVMRHAFTMTAAGVVVGVLGATALTRLLQGYLYEIRPTDPVTLAAVSVLLIGVALLAIYIPARRATAVDPITALRAE